MSELTGNQVSFTDKILDGGINGVFSRFIG